MKDEIKEICKEDNELVVYYEDNSTKTFDTLTIDVLDYITNLQDRIKELEQINEEHRKLNGELREENKHIFANVNDDQLLRSNAMNYAEAQDYKTRNEKAIEYINISLRDSFENDKYPLNGEDFEHLLNILQGKSDE